MNVGKLVVMMTVIFLVISQSGFIAQGTTAELGLGEDLVRELWNDFKTQNISALEKKIAPGFQSIHEDGARDAEAELKLLKGLNLGEYTLKSLRLVLPSL